jgi:hypothetical protein
LECVDVALARVKTEKRNSLIKAWEENEKTKAENKYVSVTIDTNMLKH